MSKTIEFQSSEKCQLKLTCVKQPRKKFSKNWSEVIWDFRHKYYRSFSNRSRSFFVSSLNCRDRQQVVKFHYWDFSKFEFRTSYTLNIKQNAGVVKHSIMSNEIFKLNLLKKKSLQIFMMENYFQTESFMLFVWAVLSLIYCRMLSQRMSLLYRSQEDNDMYKCLRNPSISFH